MYQTEINFPFHQISHAEWLISKEHCHGHHSPYKATWHILSNYNQTHKALKTSRPRQNGRHFPDDILKCISLNETISISIKISLKFVPRGSIKNIPALVQIMAWRRSGDKPLSEHNGGCITDVFMCHSASMIHGSPGPIFTISSIFRNISKLSLNQL